MLIADKININGSLFFPFRVRLRYPVSIIHFIQAQNHTKFPTLHLEKTTSYHHSSVLIHLIISFANASPEPCKAFIVVLAPSQSASISKLDTIIWLGSVHLGKDATNLDPNLDPVSSFVVNFYWAVETTDNTHQSIRNQLYRPKSNLAAQTPHCLVKFC
jgi:hypothetical protein